MNPASAPEKSARLVLVLALFATGLHVWLARTHGLAALLPLQIAGQALAAVAAVVLARAHLARRAEEERRLFELERTREAGKLFGEDSDLQLLPAVRTHGQVESWLPPAAAPLIGLFLLQAAWRGWAVASAPRPAPLEPLTALAILGGEVFAFFLLSQYLGALGRDPAGRLVRPAANLAGMVFLMAALAAAGALAAQWDYPALDPLLARGGLLVLGLVGAELILNGVSYWYRARAARTRAQPYESRLAGLVGDPGSLVGDLARSLDYQFGAGFSSSWLFRFCTRALLPLAAAQALLFWISTSVVWLEPHEVGLRQRWGRLLPGVELGPGLHVKLPAPFETVRRIPSGRVQQTQVGYEDDAPGENGEGLRIWTQPHYEKEDLFLTVQAGATTNETPTLGLLNVNVPVSYRITNAVAYATGARDPDGWLRHLAHRAMTRLLVNRSLDDLTGDGQSRAAEELRGRLQAEADRFGLGVRIETVGLHGAHPPLLVAESYEKSVGALQEKQTRIHQATGRAARATASGAGESARAISEALAYNIRRTTLEKAAAEGFTQQLAAFAKEPDVYRATLYFRTLEKALVGVRLFLLPAGVPARVFNLDLTPPPDPTLFEFNDPNAEPPNP